MNQAYADSVSEVADFIVAEIARQYDASHDVCATIHRITTQLLSVQSPEQIKDMLCNLIDAVIIDERALVNAAPFLQSSDTGA